MEAKRLTPAESLLLDIIRVGASLVVALGHLTQPYFSTGWKDATTFGQFGVAVFFVLSGFVIRQVTLRHPHGMRTYLGDRLSRIYSVAVPALALTLAAHYIARRANPGYYIQFWPLNRSPWPPIAINLLFCGQFWSHLVDPLCNSPYWSVNYEMAYYIGYGFFFYLTGRARWISIAILCVVFGPRVLFLSPLWISGCFLHDLYQRWNAAGSTWANLKRIFSFLVPALAFVAAAVFFKLHSEPHPELHTRFYPQGQRLHEVHYFFGLIWPVVFMALLHMVRNISFNPNSAFVHMVRFVAAGTFPLYLFHFPLYVLIAAVIPYNHGSSPAKLLIFCGVTGFAILAGRPCDIFKDKLRALGNPRPKKLAA